MITIDKIQYLQLGVQGDNNAAAIQIDMTPWADIYEGATFHVLYKPYNVSEVSPMLCEYDSETKVLSWTVTLSATAVAGVGYTEIRAQDNDGLVKKTRIIPTSVESSVTGVETEPPASHQPWVNQVLTVGVQARTAASNAAESAQQAAQTVAGIDAAGAAQVQVVNTAGAAQVQAVEDKGAEVLESIPADYTELTDDVNSLKSAINRVEKSVIKKYTMSDLTNTGAYIDTSGKKISTTLQLATSDMIPIETVNNIHLHKKSSTMTGYSVAFYRLPNFNSNALISGYVADFSEGSVDIPVPSGAKYCAFASRTNTGYIFEASLESDLFSGLMETTENINENRINIQLESDRTDTLFDLTVEKENIISRPSTTTSYTLNSQIFAIGQILPAGHYNVDFYTAQEAVLYLFKVDNLTDTTLLLESETRKTPIDGKVSFAIQTEDSCIIGLSGRINYQSVSSGLPFYNVTYSDGAYTKPANQSGKVNFDINVERLSPKQPESVSVSGIAYIADQTNTHVKLIGDSITQGSGSTGYVEFTLNGNTYRGNAPDYPGAGSDYQVGDFLGSVGTLYWYEALDGSGWGQLLKKYCEEKFNCTVKDYGMGGASTTDILRCWSNIIDNDDDIVIIMLGTNDRREHSLSTYKNELTTIVSNLQAMGKKVIIMSPPPLLPIVDASSQYFHMEDVCNISSAVAYKKGCQFIDNFGYIEEYCELKGVNLNTLLNSDGIHPNDTGYKVLYNNIVKELKLGRKVNGATW